MGANEENPDVDSELQILENSLRMIEQHHLASSKFVGGSEPSIADLQYVAELTQHAAGRLLHDLFEFPKVAAVMSAARTLPGFATVFKELDEFNASLPPVKSAQVTLRGNREMLKNLRAARPKRAVKNKK